MSGILTDIPQQLAASLGTTATIAALLLSCLILLGIAMACIAVGRKMNLLATSIPMFTAMAFLISIGWLPFWLLMVIAVWVALEIGGGAKKMLSGG